MDKKRKGPKEKAPQERKAAIQIYVPGPRLCELAGFPCTSINDVTKARDYVAAVLLSRIEDKDFTLEILKKG